MLKVTTVNLTPDLGTAAPNLGTCDFGELDADQMLAMMENLALVDAVQNQEADPHLIVETSAGKFRIRTGQGKLFLYDARDASGAFSELSPEAILATLSSGPHEAPPTDEDQPDALPVPKTPHNGIAITILIAGLALNGYTLYSVFYIDDVNKKPPIELVTDAKEISALQSSASGRYATGNRPGDRVIVIGADGRVQFLRVTVNGERMDNNDTYRVGRNDKKLCLTMTDSGVIGITNIDTIVYFRDTYRRVK